MDKRTFGRSGLKLSALGFGCGAVGGLMVRGKATDQERAFARALDTGINYFDTASQYGDGESEKNLGRLIRQLKPRDITFGTKVRLRPADLNNIRDAITASLAASLARLQLPQVDVFHLHNPIGGSEPGALTTDQVLNEVVPTFDTLKQQGKIRFCGLTAVGETAAIQQVVASGRIDSAQVLFNLLNPSASSALPKNYPGQDFRALLKVNASAGTGSIAIRILGGGALSGTANRQANASPAPRPIGSADTFDGDLARAQRFAPLVRDGLASSLTELAIRFAITERDVGTALIGLASQSDLDAAIAAVEKGPLPQSVLAQISAVQASFAAEA
jgi:L-galactose dehydrogenase/L-glyceraldehyde 3-phosphate reductase